MLILSVLLLYNRIEAMSWNRVSTFISLSCLMYRSGIQNFGSLSHVSSTWLVLSRIRMRASSQYTCRNTSKAISWTTSPRHTSNEYYSCWSCAARKHAARVILPLCSRPRRISGLRAATGTRLRLYLFRETERLDQFDFQKHKLMSPDVSKRAFVRYT